MAVEPITLTTAQVRAAVWELEHYNLTQRMLAFWVQYGLAGPSIDKGAPRGGAGAIWSLDDLARVRLVAHLRVHRVGTARVRAIFAYLERELAQVFKRNSKAVLVVDQARAYVVEPGRTDIEVPTGQYRLKLDAMFVGNEKAAKRAAA